MRRDKDISLLFVHFCLNYICLFDYFYLTNIYSSRNQNSIVTIIFNGAQLVKYIYEREYIEEF